MKNITIAIKDGKAEILAGTFTGHYVSCFDKVWVLNTETGEVTWLKNRTGECGFKKEVGAMKCVVFEDTKGNLRLLDENFSEMDEVNIEILLEGARARVGDRVEVTLRVLEENKEETE